MAAAVRLSGEFGPGSSSVVGGSFWSARSEAGRELLNRSVARGLWLAPGDTITFADQENDALAFRRLDLDLAVAGKQSSALHLDFRRTGLQRARLTVVPGKNVSAQLVTRHADGAERTVESTEIDGLRKRRRAPYRLTVRFDGDQVTVLLDEAQLLAGVIDLPARGRLELRTDGARFLGVRLEADRLGPSAAGPLVREDDMIREDPGRPGWRVGHTFFVLFLVGLFGLYLRSLCVGRPSLGEVVRATLAVATPIAIVVLIRDWWSPPLLVAAAVLLALLIPVALFFLRRGLVSTPEGSGGNALTMLVVTAPILLASGALAWDTRADRVELAAKNAREDAPTLAAQGVERKEPTRLDAGTAVVFQGPYAGFEFEVDVRLGPDAVLEIRQGRSDVAVGTAFLLSRYDRWPSGFIHLGPRRIDRLGHPAAVVESGTPNRLRLVRQGARFSARWGGLLVAEAEDLDARAGQITLVAVRGVVDVEGLSLVTPAHGAAGVRAAGVTELTPFLLACLILGVGAWCGSRLLRTATARTIESFAFALVPAALALLSTDDGTLATERAVAAGSLAAVLLIGVPIAHGRNTSSIRLLLAVLASGSAGALAVAVILPGAGDGASESAVRTADFASFEGPRLVPGMIHYQHPRTRAMSGHLAGHRFRGRRFEAGSRADGPRVICVGSSSTWGAGIPEASGLDWPTLLEAHLQPGTEVINGGIRGSNATLLSVFYEEVLSNFNPDVVVVSLFHNDALELAQFDAPAMLERLTDDGAAFGAVSRFLLRREIDAGSRANRRFMSSFVRGDDPVLAWQGGVGGPGVRSPPDRFLAALERLLKRVTAGGARLVLVKEAVFHEEPMIWRRSFDSVIDQLGEKYAARVVDPTPELTRRGGRDLFMDHVHLLPRGNREMARILGPVVREEIDRARH